MSKLKMRAESGRCRWQSSESCVKGVTQRELQRKTRVRKLKQVGSGGAGNQAGGGGGEGKRDSERLYLRGNHFRVAA